MVNGNESVGGELSVDQMKEVARRGLAMWGGRCEERVEDLFTAGYVNHQEPDVDGGVSDKTLAQWLELVGGFHESFSESTVGITTQIAEGDVVATHWEFSATQTGEFRGQPASGKRATWTGVQMDRFEGGKIAESWVSWDKFGLFEQLGVLE
jgi:predicted ester cyclase